MKHYRVKKSSLKGEIQIPSSKSHTLRAILFASLAEGKSIIYCYLPSSDTFSMIKACRLMGAIIDVFDDRLEIEGIAGNISSFEDVIDSGNSGIVFRFFTAIGALTKHPVVITGDHSIRHSRPIQPLLQALSQLAVSTKTMRGDDGAPVIVEGPIKSGKASLDGSDSQPVSALIIASAFAEGPIEITVKNPGEKPWILLTLDWLDRLNIPYKRIDFHHYQLFGNAHYKGFEYVVPGDFSSAAFPIVAALVTQSELEIKNIDIHDIQGDKALIDVLQKMGANIEIDEKKKALNIKKGKRLSGISVDINDFVDALPILAVTACFAEGNTLIYNGAIAKQKECNRIDAISKELQKMGANIHETADGLLIKNGPLKGAIVHSHHDHRIAMSLSVAALGAIGETVVSDIDCVNKTFPSFVSDFQKLGAVVDEVV